MYGLFTVAVVTANHFCSEHALFAVVLASFMIFSVLTCAVYIMLVMMGKNFDNFLTFLSPDSRLFLLLPVKPQSYSEIFPLLCP